MSKKEKRKTKMYLALFGVAVVGTGFIMIPKSFWQRSGRLQIAYREVPVGRGDLQVSIVSTGTVNPKNRFEIKPPVSGRIEQVLVHEGQSVKHDDVLAWMSSAERAALLDAAKAQGPNAVKRWEKNYKQIPLRAPVTGTIIRSAIEPGQTFASTESVMVMSDRLTVKAQVDETDISGIHLQAPATIVLDAYPNEEIPAHIDEIAYDARTVNNVTTYTVGVLPNETPEFMRSGMTANITFTLASHVGVINIPNDSLRVQENKYSVLVKTSGKPLEKTIVVGLTDGKRTEVTSGLSEGETVLAADIVGAGDPQSH